VSNALPGWARFGSLPFAAAVLVFLNGLYIGLVAFGNITDFGTNQPFVQHVLSMDTTNFGAAAGTDLDPDVMWRAIENETVQDVAYVGLILWETLTAVVLLASVLLWARGKREGYARARAASTIGLLMLVALFMGGFIAIGGEWFQMWKSSAWNGLEPAFRNAMLAMITLVVVHLPSREWERQVQVEGAARHP
jgi:predicted small integral membrane protein